jgi:hypothetical protein
MKREGGGRKINLGKKESRHGEENLSDLRDLSVPHKGWWDDY